MLIGNKKERNVRKWLCLLLAMCMLLGQLSVGITALPLQEFGITGIQVGVYRPANNDWYIILDTDNPDFELTSISGLKAPVDDTTAQVWFQINSQLSVSKGSFALTLAADKGEHTFTIPAGTELGGYALKEDFVIQTHADGTLEAVPQGLHITGIRQGLYRPGNNDWYIIVDTNVPDFALTAISGLKAPVDDTTAQVWFQINSQLSVPAGSFAFTLATDKAEHTVTIPAGTVLGEQALKEDFVFHTHADGTLTAETTEPETTEPEVTEPAGNTVSITGIRQSMYRPGNNDWYIILNTNIADFALTAISGLKAPVDDTTAQVWFQINSQLSVPTGNFAFTLATDKAEHTVTIPAGTVLGEYSLQEDFVFYTHADGTLTTETTEPEATEPEVTEPAGNTVSITGIRQSMYRPGNNDWYIMLNTNIADFALTAISGIKAPVDATTAQVWFQINSQLGVPAGSFAFTLAASKAEHTVAIPAGTVLGEYILQEDFVFYTHADGTLTTEATEPEVTEPDITEPTEPEEKAVSITGISGGMYRPGNSDWYIVLNTDIADFALTSISGLQAPVDNTTAQVWFQINSQLGVPAGSFAFTLAANKAEHTVTIPARTELGQYTLKEDFVFYTYADGTVGTTPPAEPVDFRFQRGVWQYVPENNLARYLVWLDCDIAGEIVIPWEPLDGAYVNGELKKVYAVLDAGSVLLILNEETGITRPGNYTVTLQKGSHIGAYTIKNDITFYTEGLTVSQIAPEPIAEPTETVNVINDSRNLTGQGTQGLYFGVTPADKLPFDAQKGAMQYSAASGGVYVNGELTSLTVNKWLENLYYVPLAQFCYPPQKGDVVTIDGVFGNGEHAVTFEKQNFVYDGEGNWEIGTYLRDLREQNYIVQDVSELKMGLSEFAIKPGVQLIGDAKRGTNIAIRSMVSVNTDATEFNFGFSKTEGMWDGAGWQVWIRPRFNQVYLAHGETDWQVTGNYEFTKTAFMVEIGTVDMHEYIDGVDQGLYCRKIFLKINGEEILSYKDTDLSRNVGKKLYVLNSQDAVNGKLISLTSKGVALRELEPTVYDYYDLTGFAADTIPGGQTVLLGETQNSSNVAVQMQMTLSGDATEVRLALAKQQKDNFWDEAGSGWQFWLRPKWDTAYIAHGTNDYEVIKPFPHTGTYTVEIGVRDVILEKNGKKIGDYCRRVYLLINGEEIASWEDMNFDRPIGNCVMLLTSQDSQVSLSTMKKTAELPVETVINGEVVNTSEFVEVISQVVSGQPSKISVLYHSDYNNKVALKGLYLNGKMLQPIESSDGKQVYALDAPVESDRLRVELEVKSLTTDETERIFDLFDTSGKAAIEVKGKQYGVSLGAMVSPEGQAEVNSAVRFRIQLPNQFNQVPIAILGDVSTLWGNSGALFQITPSQVHFCHPASMTRLASYASDWFAPGSNVCVELGIVKCYENGLYKYDRWYVKAGKTQETMEIVAWYDSVERGHYGGHFCCNGTDMEESYFLYSLKDIYTITDASSEANKEQLRTYARWGENVPELYYSGALEGYSDVASAPKVGVISFFTKPGTSLSSFTVNGVDVTKDVQIGTDGAYCYTIPELKDHVFFAYEIAEDTTVHTVTVEKAPELEVATDSDQVLTGGDLVLFITAQKGFVPQITANGTDVTQLLHFNPKTGIWSCNLRSLRSDTQIKVEAVARSYILSVEENANCAITLGGDAADGKLPFGGTLELTVQVADGYYVEYILVGDEKLSVDENGKLVLNPVYVDQQELVIQSVVRKSSIATITETAEPTEPTGQKDLTIVWIGIGAACALFIAAGVFLPKRKKKKTKKKQKKADTKNTLPKRKYKNGFWDWLCIIVLCAPAVLHLLIFWLGVQIETFKLAFTNQFTMETGWDNFQWAWEQLFSDVSNNNMGLAFRNTLTFFLMGVVLVPITMFFAYLIYRKSIGYSFSRVTLYLPGAVGGIMLALLYANLMSSTGPVMGIVKDITGNENMASLRFTDGMRYIMIFDIFVGIGGNLMIWLGSMARIPKELIEVGKLEGIGPFTEFRKVVLPLIWPTFVTMMTLQVIGIFGATGSVLALTGGANGTNTMAFWMYNMVLKGLTSEYGNVAAVGLIFTVFTIPLVVVGRWLMNRFGEEVEY